MSWLDGKGPSSYERRGAVGGSDYFVNRSSVVWGDISIGRLSVVGPKSVVVGHSPIRIGAFSRFSTRFRCVTHEQHHQELPSTFMFGDVFDLGWSHGCGAIGLSHRREVFQKFPVSIGNDVTMENDVHVFGGVTVGDGCIVRAGSLVNRDCVEYGIYEGVPARLVAKRFSDDVIQQLLQLQWWDWTIDTILANRRFFEEDLTRWSGRIEDLCLMPVDSLMRVA